MSDECRFCGKEVPIKDHFKQGQCIIRLKQIINNHYNEWRLLFSKEELFAIFTEMEGDGA